MDNEFCRELFSALNPEERIFKFKSAELTGNVLVIELLTHSSNYDSLLDERLREKVFTITKSIIPQDIIPSIKFYKSQADESLIVNKTIEYLFREHKSVYPIFAGAKYVFDQDGDFDVLKITLEKYVCEYVRGINLASELSEYLSTEFMEEIEIAFIEIPNTNTKEAMPEQFYIATPRIIEATAIDIYAKGTFINPKYICDVVEKNKEDVSLTICGVVSDIKTHGIRKNDKNGNLIEKTIYTFLLNDTTGQIRCKFFAKKRKEFDWDDVIKDSANLIMTGAYKYDTFDNRFCFTANALATADINFESINIKSNFNIDYGRYRYILPEPYNDVEQNNMFEADVSELKDFVGKTYVVFDLETTGFNLEGDEIIEIAAIKIKDGQFAEKFSTFVKPICPIPKKITTITGIDDEMVMNAPTPEYAIPDFYRFSKGCILVGHNIGKFDIPLLNFQAAKIKYEFTNDFIDTLPLARSKLHIPKYKLEEVCKHLDIPLVGAHRAINDVAANAKVFLKLMRM